MNPPVEKCGECLSPCTHIFAIVSWVPKEEVYPMCNACIASPDVMTRRGLDYMRFYQMSGGCTLSLELPWVQALYTWGIRSDTPCTVYRWVPPDTVVGETYSCTWCTSWSKNPRWPDTKWPGDGTNNICIALDLEPDDMRVVFDTTRCVNPVAPERFWNEHLVVLVSGAIRGVRYM
jgi:hypothetical protein